MAPFFYPVVAGRSLVGISASANSEDRQIPSHSAGGVRWHREGA
ncbi:hypothetical protein [Aeromonas jandaei]|nr:hypothetical protein [Aeromonas jandaei]